MVVRPCERGLHDSVLRAISSSHSGAKLLRDAKKQLHHWRDASLLLDCEERSVCLAVLEEESKEYQKGSGCPSFYRQERASRAKSLRNRNAYQKLPRKSIANISDMTMAKACSRNQTIIIWKPLSSSRAKGSWKRSTPLISTSRAAPPVCRIAAPLSVSASTCIGISSHRTIRIENVAKPRIWPARPLRIVCGRKRPVPDYKGKFVARRVLLRIEYDSK